MFTTDREGNEILVGDRVVVETADMVIYGIVTQIDDYRIQIQPNEDSYIWAHEADVTLEGAVAAIQRQACPTTPDPAAIGAFFADPQSVLR